MPIKSITYLCKDKVYDIEIPELHNFVANNIIVHNSLEHDADIVLAIHRPSYYGLPFMDEYVNRQTIQVSTRNRGHLIVLKHRDGATGFIPFYFSDNLAKIEDAEYKETQDLDYNPDEYIQGANDNDTPF